MDIDDAGSLEYVNWVQKCPGHADKDGKALVDAIVTHNATFQIAIEDQGDKAKRNLNVIAKQKEKASTIASGKPIINEKNPPIKI